MRCRALALALSLAACSGGEVTEEAASPIVGGAPTSGDPAVVMLVSYPLDKSTFETCTASLIAPDVLLTAAHCVDPATHAGFTFGVFPGADASAYPTVATLAPHLLTVSGAHPHPDYDPEAPFHADIAVVTLAEPLDVTPLPWNRAPLPASIAGAEARLVGYGQTKYGDFNAEKHQADTVVAALGSDDTVVVGDLKHRSCVGDSGGPALVILDGVETIVGVDSYAETSGCLEPAHYRRTDVHAAFLDTYAPPPTPTPVDAGSGGAGGSSSGGGGGEESTGGCALGAGAPATSTWAAAAIVAVLALLRRRR